MNFFKTKIKLCFTLSCFPILTTGCFLSKESIDLYSLDKYQPSHLLQASVQGQIISNSNLAKSFPDDVGWIDVKKEFGAKGDGINNDTKAIKRALGQPYADYGRPKILYFPAGTYIIDSTLQFPFGNNNCCVTFQGQGKEETTIKLQSSAPGFNNKNMPKALIRTTQGNMAFRNYLRDLTINTGRNNHGAIGIDYVSSNRGGVINVAIKSDDKKGVTGLSMIRQWPGPSLIKNVDVEGFDVGIHTKHREYGITLEHINLKNQKTVGILNEGNTLSIRGLNSENSIPVIRNKKGLITILEGSFSGGATKVSAINNQAYLFARRIKTEGYQSAIQDNETVIPKSNQVEYVSGQIFNLFDVRRKKSLNLPIQETPVFHDNNLSNWANVKDYPSIQSALNSGKSTIYFPKGQYRLIEDVEVPVSVNKIIGFESFINLNEKIAKGSFVINKSNRNPLIFEGLLMNNIAIKHLSRRTLVLKHSKFLTGGIQNHTNSGKLFLEDVQMFLNLNNSQNVWARQLNAERLNPPKVKIENNGGRFWILGLKTEQKGTVIKTTNGGKTELLGGLIYPVEKFTRVEANQAAFINNESSHSLSYSVSSYGPNRNYKFQVMETKDGKIKRILSTQMPDKIMPLFIGR